MWFDCQRETYNRVSQISPQNGNMTNVKQFKQENKVDIHTFENINIL